MFRHIINTVSVETKSIMPFSLFLSFVSFSPFSLIHSRSLDTSSQAPPAFPKLNFSQRLYTGINRKWNGPLNWLCSILLSLCHGCNLILLICFRLLITTQTTAENVFTYKGLSLSACCRENGKENQGNYVTN